MQTKDMPLKAVNTLLQQQAPDEAMEVLLNSIARNPFDEQLRKLQIAIHLEQGRLPEAAAAINEKARLCGLKPHDGSVIIKLYLRMITDAPEGDSFEELLSHQLVRTVTADIHVAADADAQSVCKAVNKLIDYGVYDAADQLLAAAMAYLPADPALHRSRIRCCIDRGEYSRAAAAVNRKCQACGLDEADLALLSKLHSIIVDTGLHDNEIDEFMSKAWVRKAVADNVIYCGFESLGDDCELGFVQRKLGQEPLSLLRFSSIPLPTLIKLLNNDFRNFALPDNCELRIANVGSQAQYDLYDRAYNYQIHTFIVADKISDAPSVLAKFCARIQFLKRKLLDDLAAGEKIFVYKTRELSDKEIQKLSRALQRHGPNRLLFIQEINGKHDRQGPSIVQLSDIIVKGYLSRFDVQLTNPSVFSEWQTLLDAAHKEFSEKSAGTRAPGFFSKAAMFIRGLRIACRKSNAFTEN